VSTWLFLLAALLVVAGLGLLWWGRQLRRQTGLPAGTVVYSDTGAEQAVLEPLVSHRYGLVGKPDYLVDLKHGGNHVVVPLEVKSRNRPASPNAGHILQLIAYCLIVEDLYGQRPPHGYLRYADATLTIPNSDVLRAEVLQAADAIRGARRADNVRRSHTIAARCEGCGYLHACGAEALGGQGARRGR
jgi:CRISPR-associated exonuclease Cas4